MRDFPYPYVLALLNSRILEFYLKQISPYASGKYYRYTNEYLSRLPLRKAGKKTVAEVTGLVLKLMKLTKMLNPNIEEITHGMPLLRKPGVEFDTADKIRLDSIEITEHEIRLNGGRIKIEDRLLREYIYLYMLWLKKQNKNELRRDEIMKIPVPNNLREATEKMSILRETRKQKVLKKIAELEDELNEIIYRLYGINREEMDIIEAEIWRGHT